MVYSPGLLFELVSGRLYGPPKLKILVEVLLKA